MSKKYIYVIHKHKARHLHYDLRLEYRGALLSWAIPKLPPQKYSVKRLAIRVEDHQLDYANFEGRIPEGLYGAGVVEIWDRGNYKLLKFAEDEIIIDINGEKLKGIYCLIKLKNNVKGKNWLFFKKKFSE